MANATLTRAIDALASRRDLSADETASVLAEIMHGEVSEIQIAAFLIALRTKGETIDELTGLARTMRELAVRVPTAREDLLDTAGTGGGRRTFNVSTTAALIAAGAGCAVAKHGNRSATSASGSADLLEALGARIDLDPAGVAECIEEAGFGFMFAPAHHQATRFVVPVRRELAVRTIFNLLGPLTNPAGARRQLIGVSDQSFLETIAGALSRLGVDRALIVSSEDGLDEISISAGTKVVEVNGEEITRYTLAPGDVGIELAPKEIFERDSAGGTPEQNAAITRAVLDGETQGAGSTASLDLAIINAGAAIYVAGRAASIADGVEAARVAIVDGSAAAALEGYVQASVAHVPAEAAPVSTRTPSVLERILQSTREQLELRKREVSPQLLEDRMQSAAGGHEQRAQRSLRDALARPGIGVIAEFKRRSPSAGSLRAQADLPAIVGAYQRGGASGLSVLTEEPGFGGSLADLRAARGACELPILRKDFIVDRYQLHEAVLAGADAVLLIVAALSGGELRSLNDSAGELGLDVLVEVHDRRELQSALELDPRLVGINNRDLRDFSVDVARTTLLMSEMPAGVTVVSESGITGPEQLRSLEREGVDAVLVGEALMRAPDPQAALEALLDANSAATGDAQHR